MSTSHAQNNVPLFEMQRNLFRSVKQGSRSGLQRVKRSPARVAARNRAAREAARRSEGNESAHRNTRVISPRQTMALRRSQRPRYERRPLTLANLRQHTKQSSHHHMPDALRQRPIPSSSCSSTSEDDSDTTTSYNTITAENSEGSASNEIAEDVIDIDNPEDATYRESSEETASRNGSEVVTLIRDLEEYACTDGFEEIASTERSKTITATEGFTILKDVNFSPELLVRRTIFADYLPTADRRPRNLSEILRAISHTPHSSTDEVGPSEQDILEYDTYSFVVTRPADGKDVAFQAFLHFFDISSEFRRTHACGSFEKEANLDEQESKQKIPWPDYLEGFPSSTLPRWVQKHSVRDGRLYPGPVFPNFLAEYNLDSSSRKAHNDCRLDGAFATHGYYMLYSLLGNPDEVLDTALVGTVEFSGETFIGNVHWVSKKSDDGQELVYHTKRVVCGFTRGLGVEVFIKARHTARNFRAYFEKKRLEHFERLWAFRTGPYKTEDMRRNDAGGIHGA